MTDKPVGSEVDGLVIPSLEGKIRQHLPALAIDEIGVACRIVRAFYEYDLDSYLLMNEGFLPTTDRGRLKRMHAAFKETLARLERVYERRQDPGSEQTQPYKA